MAEELLVVLNRNENSGFGFSLLGKPGLPPIIYNILDDSPAAESGEVEVGDVILKVNEIDVIKYSTREDPKIKSTVRKHLQSAGGGGAAVRDRSPPGGGRSRPEPGVHRAHHGRHAATNGRLPPEHEPLLVEHHERLQGDLATPKGGAPKFEAYMMTGEHILNISRVPQAGTIVPKQQKKADHSRYHNSHAHHLRHQPSQYNSVPNSPNETELGRSGRSSGPNSAHTSPVGGSRKDHPPLQHSPQDAYAANSFVRTSRSEDQLQLQNSLGGAVSTANSEADEDIASSLNTLLDTRPDSANSDSDRIVWTYNAPISELHKLGHTLSNGSSSSHSNTSASSSPLHTGSPNSPTSVSSSVMSSQSGSRRLPYSLTNGPQQQTFDFSVSEAISNISSPDYHDDDSVGIRDCVMEISDHSDSDSTLLGPEPSRLRSRANETSAQGDHRIVIQVRGPQEKKGQVQGNGDVVGNNTEVQMQQDYNEEDREEEKKSSPLSSEDESDVESLHSFHYSPKAVDMPSAIRLAKRLYSLDGFKKSDVSRHLSKNNDFSKAVAEEYLKYFNFEKDTLDIALRMFLKQFSLTGETQERERVLVHFSKRYLDCNPGSFNSQDAVHTLTCAIMLLNTDLHAQNIGRKMTCNEFIENLTDLNEGENFPRDVLKHLYHAIKNHPLEWALDDEQEDGSLQSHLRNSDNINLTGNPFLDMPNSSNAVEYKKGYVMRKCCYETNAKRSICCIFLAPFHKRSWKMFYCTLRDLVLYLHKDENGFRKNQMGGDNLHNAIRIHHALATKAQDYTKKQYVFRLQTADQAEYLFQTSDSKELQSWIDTINFVAASFSAPPLEAAVGSQKKFQRPLLSITHTKFNLREQLADHEERVMRLEAMLDEHRKSPPEKGSKSLIVQNYKEKEAYLTFEVKRYHTYAYILRSRAPPLLAQTIEPAPAVRLAENSIGEVDESTATGQVMVVDSDQAGGLVPPPIPERKTSPVSNRYNLKIVHIIYNPVRHCYIPLRKSPE
ncbi:exchange factor for Arf 6 isoform X5 [Rhynchophorus ferrugineus]|uniref:exchange factor for Arf 6 isoform X5 n=1 Tax=Rhynchophorus ferrugineus TaxID=354439 RepID=UPI003FCEA3D9